MLDRNKYFHRARHRLAMQVCSPPSEIPGCCLLNVWFCHFALGYVRQAAVVFTLDRVLQFSSLASLVHSVRLQAVIIPCQLLVEAVGLICDHKDKAQTPSRSVRRLRFPKLYWSNFYELSTMFV